ncbi:MAG: GMC family oxidoreductase [Acidimicrobiales bacterium]|jgi:choline dehydrogenase-like flavoprotein
MTDEPYDVVIVGGGIAGATVAKTIADTGGKRILILEAGRATGMSADKYGSLVEAFQASLAKVPNAPYPNNPNAPQPDVLDIRQLVSQPGPGVSPRSGTDDHGYFVQSGPLAFQSDYTRALGGTTLHWLGTCLRMLPNDFRIRSLYGQGIDWPMTYEDLRPYYERAETDVIGVAGSTSDQFYPGIDDPTYFGDYEYPMHRVPPSYLDQVLADRLDGRTISVQGAAYEVKMSNTPAGRNSVPRPGYQPVGAPGNPQTGERCEGNTNCIPICPAQAKYSALKTLYELMRRHPGTLPPTPSRSSVTIISQAVATRIEIDEHRRVGGITFQAYENEQAPPSSAPQTVRAKRYVLAANAIENATLLLASGAANSSGMVGRNLMDHPLILTWGLMPIPVWGFRGPLSTSGLEMFRDGAFRSHNSAFRIEIGNEGWSFAADAPSSTVDTLVGRGLFGRELRTTIGRVVPRQFRLALEMEQLPEATNFVTIDGSHRDQLGNFRPVIHYDLPDYVRAGFAMAKEASDAMYALLGVPPLLPTDDPATFPYPRDYTEYHPTDPGYVLYEDSGYTFQGAGHLVGTHRMGMAANTSVVDPRQRTWDHDNLYLAGCGNMPTIGTSNPTLTMTALAVWLGDNIVDDLAALS